MTGHGSCNCLNRGYLQSTISHLNNPVESAQVSFGTALCMSLSSSLVWIPFSHPPFHAYWQQCPSIHILKSNHSHRACFPGGSWSPSSLVVDANEVLELGLCLLAGSKGPIIGHRCKIENTWDMIAGVLTLSSMVNWQEYLGYAQTGVMSVIF